MKSLARALVPVAHRALSLPVARPSEDEPLLGAALDAIDGFIAAPSAARYLAATRTLKDLARLRGRSREAEQLARRALDVELDRLDALALLPPTGEDATDPLEVLRALPPDPRAARRVHALVALLEAHRELAVRVRAPEAHRARMTVPAGATRSKDRRRRATSR